MKVPTGFGTNALMTVFINGREADYGTVDFKVDFKAPTVISTVSPLTTEGGQIQVNGTGFGPVGQSQQIDSVKIKSAVGAMTCTNTIVTVEDTLMTCDVFARHRCRVQRDCCDCWQGFWRQWAGQVQLSSPRSHQCGASCG